MMKKRSYLMLWLISIVIPISCMDQEEITINEPDEQNEVISEAKHFFENQFTSEMKSSVDPIHVF